MINWTSDCQPIYWIEAEEAGNCRTFKYCYCRQLLFAFAVLDCVDSLSLCISSHPFIYMPVQDGSDSRAGPRRFPSPSLTTPDERPSLPNDPPKPPTVSFSSGSDQHESKPESSLNFHSMLSTLQQAVLKHHWFAWIPPKLKYKHLKPVIRCSIAVSWINTPR